VLVFWDEPDLGRPSAQSQPKPHTALPADLRERRLDFVPVPTISVSNSLLTTKGPGTRRAFISPQRSQGAQRKKIENALSLCALWGSAPFVSAFRV
jgi:hypothetical protein